MEHPTSVERLNELTGMVEETTTGGNMTLTSDDAGDIYAWLSWIDTLRTINPVDRDYQAGIAWGD